MLGKSFWVLIRLHSSIFSANITLFSVVVFSFVNTNFQFSQEKALETPFSATDLALFDDCNCRTF